MFGAAHGAADEVAAKRRRPEHVDQCLARGRDAGRVQHGPQLGAGARPVSLHLRGDRLHAEVSLTLAHALLRQPASVGNHMLRGDQRMQPPVVLRAHQMQGAPVEPGDEQRPPIAERRIEVGRREPECARTNAEPGAAGILCLNGQQPLDDRLRGRCPRTAELLAPQALGGQGVHAASCSSGPVR